MKKVLALVLALMMAVSLMVSANAKIDYPDAADVDPKYQEAVEVITALKLMVGVPAKETADTTEAEDTTTDTTTEAATEAKNIFDPKGNLTRGEYATILFKLRTGAQQEDELYERYASKNYFSDVPASNYAAVAINYLKYIGAMNGTGGDKFEPDLKVDGYQVVQGILQAIGYGKLDEFGGSYEEAKLQTAAMGNQKGITTGLNITHKNYVTRELLAAMLFNTLTNRSAHVVTLKSDGKNYVEEENNARVFPTLGETHWKLHLFTVYSGKTYPEDKKLQKLDEFGRPTNPKWMALVDGVWTPIGTDSKALYCEEHSAGKMTRQDLEKIYYESFSKKDGITNTEFYIDGKKIDTLTIDPVTRQRINRVWEDAGINIDEDYDKIGGVDVTVEVYMMADEYTAISSEKVLTYLDKSGDSTVGTNDTWPRMRVVIVHHYAAKVTQQMIYYGDTYPDTLNDGKTYTVAAHLELPYDDYNYATTAWENNHPGVTAETVILPMASNDEYKKDDVLYFEVAIQKDKNGVEKHNVLNVQKLTATPGIAYVDPDKTYVRPAKTDDAKYISYFMQRTAYDQYKASKVSAKEGQSVYLDPTGQFVALIDQGPAPATNYVPSGYLYVDSIQIRALNPNVDNVLWNNYPLEVRAKVIDVLAGADAKYTSLPLQFKAEPWYEDQDGNGEPDLIPDYEEDGITPIPDTYMWRQKGYKITELGGITLERPLCVGFGLEFKDYRFDEVVNAVARTTAVNPDKVYADLENDTVYKVLNDTTVVIPNVEVNLCIRDHKAPIELDSANVYIATDGHGNLLQDKNGGLVYFTVYNQVPYILDMYTTVKAHTTDLVGDVTNIDLAEITWKAFQNKNTQSWNAYSNVQYMFAKSTAAQAAYDGRLNALIDGNGNFGWLSIANNSATYVAPEDAPTPTDVPLDHQFARVVLSNVASLLREDEPWRMVEGKYKSLKVTGSTLTFDLVNLTAKDPYKAYDRDVDSYYEDIGVQSGVIILNGSNSIKLNGKTIFINESTLLYSFKGEYVGDWENDGFEDLTYMGTYIYGEFDEFKASEPYFALVVCDPSKDYDVASRIVIISEDAEAHEYNNTVTGIYCGLTEQDGKSYVYYVDVKTGLMKYLEVANNSDQIKDDLRNKVGQIITFKTNALDKAYSWISESIYTVEGFNDVENLDTKTSVIVKDKDGAYASFDLDKATYYYVGNHYLSKVTKSYLTQGAKVSIHLNGDHTVTVVIYNTDILASFEDGAPYYGTLDGNWPGRI